MHMVAIAVVLVDVDVDGLMSLWLCEEVMWYWQWVWMVWNGWVIWLLCLDQSVGMGMVMTAMVVMDGFFIQPLFLPTNAWRCCYLLGF